MCVFDLRERKELHVLNTYRKLKIVAFSTHRPLRAVSTVVRAQSNAARVDRTLEAKWLSSVMLGHVPGQSPALYPNTPAPVMLFLAPAVQHPTKEQRNVNGKKTTTI